MVAISRGTLVVKLTAGFRATNPTHLKKMAASFFVMKSYHHTGMSYHHLWHENENMAQSEDQEASFV